MVRDNHGERGTLSNQVLVYDDHSRHWSEQVTRGAAPSPRSGHYAEVLGDRMFVFGGDTGEPADRRLTQMHVLDLFTFSWSLVDTGAHAPSVGAISAVYVAAGRIFCVCGGEEHRAWVYRPDPGTWDEVSPA